MKQFGADLALSSGKRLTETLENSLDGYSCLKCGSSGDSKEANYRYRLSLEVADTQNVFEVTVFGSCLDVYFGVTAKGLQSYIENLPQDVGEPDRDSTPDVLFHAVESCFIGKKFVFGIKDYDKPECGSFWQNDHQTTRYPKALTACQMFMPNSRLIGNTVIHYLQRRQCSHFKQGHRDIWPPDLFMAFDEPSSELSSLHGTSDSGVVPSCSARGLSALWPQSFGLTSSPVSPGTIADPIDLNPSKTAYSRQKWEDNPVSVHSQLICNSQGHKLTETKRNVQEDQKSQFCSSQRSCIATKGQPESDSSLGREGCRSLQSPLEEKNLPGEISLQHNYWLKKPHGHLAHQRQGPALCFPASSSIHLPAREDANSQEVPWLWDELPSSESLNEFIAKLESDKAMGLPATVQVHFPSDGVGAFQGHFDQLSPKPGIFPLNLKTGEPGEKLQLLAEKVESHKEDTLLCRQLHPLPLHSSQESHREAFYSSSYSKGKEKSRCPSHQHLPFLPSSKEGIDKDVSSSKNRHSSSSSESSSNCLENSCPQSRNVTVCLSGQDGGNLFKRRGKGSPPYSLSQTADVTNIQEDDFASGTCKKPGGLGATKRALTFQVNGCCFKGDDGSSVQNCSDGHEVSYNVSADLFESAREAGPSVGKLNSAHVFLAQENPLTKQCITSEFTPSRLNGSWDTSLGGTLISPDPKTNSPAAGLIPGSEHSLAGSLDFIPNSQSTPLARPWPQVRLPLGKESILRELPLNKLSWVGAKCQRLRPALGNPSVKRLVSKFLQSRRSSDASDGQQLFPKGSLAQGLPESDGEEWIPPSEKKQVQPLGIQKGKVLRKKWNLTRSHADRQATEKSLSQSKVRCGVSRNSISLVRVELSPERPTEIRFGRQPVSKDSADCWQVMNGSPGFSVFAEVRSNLSSTPRSTPNIPSWSPELFSDHGQPLSTDAIFTKSST